MMKIAFFSPIPFSEKLGATKNRIELASTLEKLGWETYLISSSELGLAEDYRAKKDWSLMYSMALKSFLQLNADKYDVVLYEYYTLPYSRKLFSANTLFIARPALLHYHFKVIKFPVSAKSKIKNVFTFFLHRKRQKMQEKLCEYSIDQADVIQVQNEWDKRVLIKNNFPAEKIINVPNGISKERRMLFQSASQGSIKDKKLAFVGTFDYRKGACDFPKIVALILDKVPDCKIKLIGTNGLFENAEQVRLFFPKKIIDNLEVIPTFSPERLPHLLSDCILGIFPSYIESFGFGVLEMMTAGLPVVCYDSPGPSDFVPKELLIEPGNTTMFANKVIDIIGNKTQHAKYSRIVSTISEDHCWETIGKMVSDLYHDLHFNLVKKNSCGPITDNNAKIN